MGFTIQSSFIGNFKLGDNINHNLRCVCFLYDSYGVCTPEQKSLLRKPITVLLVSVLEAVLYDFHERIQKNTYEGVQNVAAAITDYIRGKKVDELEKLIASARKHDLFIQASTDFYERLDELRKLRNRVHIQNSKNHFEPDDQNAFSERRMKLAERALERTLRTMVARYSRAPSYNYCADFELPWEPHYPE